MLGLGLDQLVKLASVSYLPEGRSVSVLGDLLLLRLVRNPGAAFGMGANSTIVFTIFAIAATLACLFIALPRITRLLSAVTLGLLLAGITGNLFDRVMRPPAMFHGHVIDMFQVPFFAIFNVADIFITVAAGLILLTSFTSEDEKTA